MELPKLEVGDKLKVYLDALSHSFNWSEIEIEVLSHESVSVEIDGDDVDIVAGDMLEIAAVRFLSWRDYDEDDTKQFSDFNPTIIGQVEIIVKSMGKGWYTTSWIQDIGFVSPLEEAKGE